MMMLISVDLPAPFSPNSACTSPSARSKSTLSRAVVPAKRLVIPRSDSIIAGRPARGRAGGRRWWPASRDASLDVELRLVVARRQDLVDVDRLQRLVGDQVGRHAELGLERLLLERADREVDADAAHHHRILGREPEDLLV